MAYQHKQLGFILITVFVIVFLFLVDLLTLSIIFWHDSLPAYVTPLLIAATILIIIAGDLFSSMTIRIEDEHLIWHFGFGFWKNRVQLNEIRSSEPVRNKWWYGWGIRKIPGGWLYNVSGLDAVEFSLENGRLFRLGSDETDKLLTAVKAAQK